MRLLRFRADHVPEKNGPKKDEHKKPRRLAYLALGGFFALCGMPDPAHSRPIMTHAPPAPQRLESTWDSGTCGFEDNRLSYRSGRLENSITLDVEVQSPENILCARHFTVVMTPGEAVISLGGEHILQGREMLGRIGERFLAANSYSLGIKEIRAKGITGASLSGSTFCITTGSESDCIDLSNPVEWRIY